MMPQQGLAKPLCYPSNSREFAYNSHDSSPTGFTMGHLSPFDLTAGENGYKLVLQ